MTDLPPMPPQPPRSGGPMPAYAGPQVPSDYEGYAFAQTGPQPWHRHPVIRNFARFGGPFGWMFVALVAMFGCGVCVPPLAMLWWAPLVFIISLAAVRAMSRVRTYRANTVLAYVNQAVRLNMPLYEYLLAATYSEGYFIRRRLGQLTRAIGSGAPLAEALARTVPEMPDRTIALVRVAESTGQLPQALHRAVAESRRDADEHLTDLGALVARVYPVWLIFATFSIVSFNFIFVVPKFREIFKDFRTTVPALTEWLLATSDWVVNDYGVLLILPFVLWMLIYIGDKFRRAVWGRVDAFWPRRWRDVILWYTPLASPITQARGLADACVVIADAVDAGVPLVHAVRLASQLDVNTVLRDRLSHWAAAMNAGRPIADAASVARMPPIVVEMLRTGEVSGEFAATMRFLARYYASRFSRAAIVFVAVAKPAMVLFMALIVAFICVALFLPLVKLIQSVSGGENL